MLMVPGGVQESRLQEAGFMFNMEKSVWYTREECGLVLLFECSEDFVNKTFIKIFIKISVQ